MYVWERESEGEMLSVKFCAEVVSSEQAGLDRVSTGHFSSGEKFQMRVGGKFLRTGTAVRYIAWAGTQKARCDSLCGRQATWDVICCVLGLSSSVCKTGWCQGLSWEQWLVWGVWIQLLKNVETSLTQEVLLTSWYSHRDLQREMVSHEVSECCVVKSPREADKGQRN